MASRSRSGALGIIAAMGLGTRMAAAAPVVGPSPALQALEGRVTEVSGRPVPGVWVSAIDWSTPTHVRHAVVTGDDGTFRIPDLVANHVFHVRLRAYGFGDRWFRDVHPGAAQDFKYVAGDRLSEVETAGQYPANYWLDLMSVPDGGATPAPELHNNAAWTTNVLYICAHCHNIGTPEMRAPRTREQWEATFRLSPRTEFEVRKLGKDRVLDLFSNWSERIRSGALPAMAPTRPTGAAAQVAVTEWDVGGPLTWFRELAAGYAWDARVGAAPPRGRTGKWVYVADVAWGTVVGIDVDTGEKREWRIPFRGKLIWPYGSWNLFRMNSAPITLNVDREGKIVIAANVSDEDPPGTLSRGFANVGPLLPPLEPPLQYGGNHDLLIFDPRTESFTPILTQCDNHAVSIDLRGRYWLSREEDRICMYDPATHKETAFVWPKEWDRIGVGYNDVGRDGRDWFFFSREDWLAVFDPARSEFRRWLPPEPLHLPRHVCLDSQDRPYVLFLSGHLGRFDPRTEKFTFWELPEARLRPGGLITNAGFTCVVDRFGQTGIKDAVYIAGNFSNSLIQFNPADEKFVNFRMPDAFYTKDLEVHDGAVWAVDAEHPEKYLERDAETPVGTPRLFRIAFPKGGVGSQLGSSQGPAEAPRP